jgi:hypothetical protein
LKPRRHLCLKADISTTINGATTHIDVAIAEGTSPTYISAHKAATQLLKMVLLARVQKNESSRSTKILCKQLLRLGSSRSSWKLMTGLLWKRRNF